MTETTKWEYRVETFGGMLTTPKENILEDTLNTWGEDGWEVISAHSIESSYKVRIIAKRPLGASTRRERSRPS